jgi:UDP-N-acetylmuramoyl-L-alanyl-D-glutamate--2,6-diaminopimelate ligase
MSEHSPRGKSLTELGLVASDGVVGNPEITGICVDSRYVKAGDLFAAMPGALQHGGEFIQFAVRMDAGAILTDAKGLEIAKREVAELNLPIVVVPDPRMALSKAAARFYGAQPASMTAVTGTNGKTSVANFTRQIWESLGKQAVNFGTAGVEGAYAAALSHTTPEPITLHKLLRELKQNGITHAAMEASSHGLDQRRLDGVYLTAAAFTNFTQDHLDYHESFEEYFEAKAGLFSRVLPPEGSAVINMDDPKGADIKAIAQSRGQDIITVGAKDCDLTLQGCNFDATGQQVLFSWRGEVKSVRLELIGGFQAMNVLQAAALVIACGEPADPVFDTLAELETVSGRMQLAAKRTNGASVFVDYAHTPDAIETALKAMRPHVMGRLIVIVGAGGDRDVTKRPLMGQAAAKNADVVFVTDDNPRSEDPGLIRRAVMQGCPDATEIGDRATAILTGVDALQPGDALLIAGKGHETGQIIGDDVLAFNDVEQASISVAALDELGA